MPQFEIKILIPRVTTRDVEVTRMKRHFMDSFLDSRERAARTGKEVVSDAYDNFKNQDSRATRGRTPKTSGFVWFTVSASDEATANFFAIALALACNGIVESLLPTEDDSKEYTIQGTNP